MEKTGLFFRYALSTLLCAALISCTALSPTNATKEFILTVNLLSTDTEQALLSRYGGNMLSFNPKAGFAILKVSTPPAPTDTAIKSLEANTQLGTTDAKISLNQPNLNIQGASTGMSSVGMSGWATWSSGWSTWSSGWSTWSSGQTLPSMPLQTNGVYMNSRVPQAHAIARNFGTGVTVAVLDTGIDIFHPGFWGRLTDSTKRWNFVDNNNNVNEVSGGAGYGHGTAVAGIILQVAPKATIMPLKVLDANGAGDLDNVIAAIDYAVKNGAQVINISLGSHQFSDALWTVINNAIENKVYVVAAVGNEGQTNSADYPGALGYRQPNFMIGVGSVSATDQLSSFTNRGGDVLMYAPGENVPTLAPKFQTANATGTSFSTPLVAGALALAYGEATTTQARETLGSVLRTSNEGKRPWWRFYSSSQICDSQGSTWCHGEGQLDVERLLLKTPGFIPAMQKSTVDFITNGNFEFAGTGVQGWTTSPNVVFNDNDLFSGSYAALISGIGFLTQRVTGLTPNTTYRLIGWTRVNRASSSIRFRVANFGGTTVSRSSTQTSFGNLQPINFTFTTGSSSTTADVFIEKTTGISSNNNGWIDLVTLTRN
jgi:hypothetical protein